MARYPIRVTVRDGVGRVLEDSTVVVYEAGTLTVATIYELVSGGSPVASVAADERGMAVAYVEDSDYPRNTMFDLAISKADHESVTISNVLP